MEHLYVIPSKDAHISLLTIIFGDNPLRLLKFSDSVAIYCPGDPSQNKILDREDYLYEDDGTLRSEYSGRTTFIY